MPSRLIQAPSCLVVTTWSTSLQGDSRGTAGELWGLALDALASGAPRPAGWTRAPEGLLRCPAAISTAWGGDGPPGKRARAG